jgi:hypothetical protein
VKLEFEVLDPRIPDKAPQFASGTMQDGIPDRQHLLVIPESSTTELRQTLQGRRYGPCFTWPWQRLEVYEVMAKGSSETPVCSR